MMNFDYKLEGQTNMEEDIYAGREAFSEAESRIVRDYVHNLGKDLHIAILLYSPLFDTNVYLLILKIDRIF